MFPGHQALDYFLSYIYTRTMWLTLNYRNSISSHIKTCANNQNHQIVIHNACHYFSLHDSFSVLTRWVWYRLLLPPITSSLLFNVREIKDYKTHQAHKFRVSDHFVLSTFKSSCWLCTKMLQLISLWIFFFLQFWKGFCRSERIPFTFTSLEVSSNRGCFMNFVRFFCSSYASFRINQTITQESV